MGLSDALSDHCKKFHDKTKNQWAERADFETVNGKYTLIQRDYGETEPAATTEAEGAAPSQQPVSAHPTCESSSDSDVPPPPPSPRWRGWACYTVPSSDGSANSIAQHRPARWHSRGGRPRSSNSKPSQ